MDAFLIIDEVAPDAIPTEILCLEIPEIPNLCRALLPGGIELEDPDLLRLVQPALAPLVPLFDILEAVVSIKKCIEAIPDALGPPPDPSKLADCIPDLAEKIAKLLRLMPALSLPSMIRQLLNCAIGVLLRLRSFLVGLKAQLERIARIVEKAAELDDPALNAIAACASDRAGVQFSNEMKELRVVGRLLGTLRTLVDLAGVPVTIPDLSSIAGVPIDDVLDPLDDLIRLLRETRDAVPDVLESLEAGDLL